MSHSSHSSHSSHTFEILDNISQNAIIKVIGVGGGGGNAIEYMINANVPGMDSVEFICANTDAQALRNTSSKAVLQLGMGVTKGLGAGADPEIGRQSALEDRDRIRDVLTGADMVFITAGMGGGTGTGAAPIVAEVAKELGALTVAVVTKPFPFEGKKRSLVADDGLLKLSEAVDSLITIPNQKLLSVLGKNISLLDAFRAANNVLLGAVQGIAELITRPGLINVDFADVRTVMSEMGMAMMGTGIAQGENRAREAAEAAISSPLLDDVNLSGAKGVLVNITAGLDMGIAEFEEVGNAVKSFTSDDATVIVGTVIDPNMRDELRVTLVATGLNKGLINKHLHASANNAANPNQTALKEDINSLAASHLSSQRANMGGFGKRASVAGASNLAHQLGNRKKSEGTEGELDYLDIPAFMRRQNQDSEIMT
ncbi:MAG: cell division protein FtsZ [Gammaproteobacteria bacterium]